ncbi:MAG TPA: hypothetical protein VFL91_18455, partial [Thermomicrobiales bacterium]|nr:hypothetical protein [Thermomicrobiales bacterium]
METSSSPSRSCVSGGDTPLTLDEVVPRLLAMEDDPGRRRFAERCLDAFGADALLPALATAFQRYFSVQTRAALRVAEALEYAAVLAGRPGDRATGLMGRADGLRILGRYQEALDLYREAQRAFLA